MTRWTRWEIALLLVPVFIALLVTALILLSGCVQVYGRGTVCG